MKFKVLRFMKFKVFWNTPLFRFVDAYVRYRGNYTISALKMEAVKAYETSITIYQSRWRRVPEEVALSFNFSGAYTVFHCTPFWPQCRKFEVYITWRIWKSTKFYFKIIPFWFSPPAAVVWDIYFGFSASYPHWFLSKNAVMN